MADKDELDDGEVPTTKSPLSDNELEVAFSGPAVFVNRVFFTSLGHNARLAFVEHRKGQGPQFRAAVLMTIGDLMELRDLLNGIEVEKIEIPPPDSNTEE